MLKFSCCGWGGLSLSPTHTQTTSLILVHHSAVVQIMNPAALYDSSPQNEKKRAEGDEVVLMLHKVGGGKRVRSSHVCHSSVFTGPWLVPYHQERQKEGPQL